MKKSETGIHEQIRQTLSLFYQEGYAIEICCIGPNTSKSDLWEGWTQNNEKGIIAGWFNDLDKAQDLIVNLDKQSVNGIYLTLNPCVKALLGRANNKLKAGVSRTTDKDVTSLSWLLIDIDPERPSGISSSDHEKDIAKALMENIKKDLMTIGWPEPICADSGNGYHLLFRLEDLEPSSENVELNKQFLQKLADRYDSEVKIDQKVFNPARITKLYGTMTRKGDHIEDRPHRRSKIISIPEKLSVLKQKQIAEYVGKTEVNAGLKNQDAKRTESVNNNQGSKLDVRKYLTTNGIKIKKIKDLGNRTLFELKECLFDPSHNGGEAFITQFENGGFDYSCHHGSCSKYTWKDARQKISGTANLKFQLDQDEDDRSPQVDVDEKASQSKKIVDLIDGSQLFKTEDSDTYCRLNDDKGNVVLHRIESESFKHFLSWKYYKICQQPPNSTAINDAAKMIHAMAIYEGTQRDVFLRYGSHKGKIYVDLGTKSWEAVEIDEAGWRIVKEYEPLFWRPKGFLALPTPLDDGDLETELKPFLNLSGDDDWKLLVGWILGSMFYKIPHPILVIQGEQGSAKSTTVRIIRKLVDPNIVALKTMPDNERDLIINAKNSWVLAYDNISHISNNSSDALCRIATGGGYGTRKLYTDSEEMIFSGTRPIILNGIDDLIRRHDLADRAIVINLDPISPENRRTEGKIFEDFEDLYPSILGKLYSAISCALRERNSINLPEQPRMADFVSSVLPAESELGWASYSFYEAFVRNQKAGIEQALENDMVAVEIMNLVRKLKNSVWEGSASDLKNKLDIAVGDKTSKNSMVWPQAASALSKRLKRSSKALREEYGINVEHDKNSSGRIIRISKLSDDSSVETD